MVRPQLEDVFVTGVSGQSARDLLSADANLPQGVGALGMLVCAAAACV